MNVHGTRSPQPNRIEEAPATRPGKAIESTRASSPSEVLAILEPRHDEPAPIMIGGLWKTGLASQGVVS